VSSMQLSELRTWFYDLMGLPSDDNRYTSTMVKSYLNIANQEWCARTNANEKSASVTIVQGTDAYALPADFIRDVGLIYDGKPLQRRDMRERPDYDSASTGVPEAYWVWGGKVYLYPIPNAVETCTLQYTSSPADMSADADTPGWVPGAYHKALVFYAVQLAKGSEGVADAAGYWLAQFEKQAQEYQTYKALPSLARGARMRLSNDKK
jgi:hypothetical protein